MRHIGKGLCELWCRRNQVVPDQGFTLSRSFCTMNIGFRFGVSLMAGPLWFTRLMMGSLSHRCFNPSLMFSRRNLTFLDVVLHVYPRLLSDHSMCGAAAIAFLGHIIVGAELPVDLEALGYMHSNMKASFVQALFDGTCCICPVSWGSGGNGSLVKSLSAELVKHGVPENLSDQRAQQAIKVIGSEMVAQAMGSKNVWRSLKQAGNNVRFQFLLPEELAAVVSNVKGVPVGKRMKKG